MFSQERDGKLSVAICDLGAGIPGTLPSKQPKLWKRILRVKRFGDADVIKHAVSDSISRTGAGHRGHGLGQIVRVVESIPGAQVIIFSNKGIYGRIAGRKVLVNHSSNILGTLIFWEVPLMNQHAEISSD